MLYKNYGTRDNTLCGSTPIRFEPGAVIDIDPERLKMYLPSDVEDIRPYVADAPIALGRVVVADEDPEGVETGELFKLLAAANAVVDRDE